MQRTCVKCDHVNTQSTGAPDEACPQCGAIYAKASATASRPVAARAPGAQSLPSGFAQSSSFGSTRPGAVRADERHHERAADLALFVALMREQTLYPAVRAAVRWAFIIMSVIAAVLGISALFQAVGGSALAGLAALGGAAFLLVVAFVMRELSLMLVDLSDAAVRNAAAADLQREQ